MTLFDLTSIDGISLQTALHPGLGPRKLGGVIQLHGITADMDEGGMFGRLAESLAKEGFDVLRFSFRGHGRSGGTQKGMTIAGEMLDFQAALEFSALKLSQPLAVVAASFGAVSGCLSLPFIKDRLRTLVLWNPVLDLKKTFIDPELPWGIKNFTGENRQRLMTDGYLLVDNSFKVGRVLFEEMTVFKPLDHFLSANVPSLIVHGDRDNSVSYEVSRLAAQRHSNCTLNTIEGSDHGFDGADNEQRAIAATVNWMRKQYGG